MTIRMNTLIITLLFFIVTALSACKTTDNVPFIPGQGLTGGAGGRIIIPPPGSGGGSSFDTGNGGGTECSSKDVDGDGFSECEGDCNDEKVNINPSPDTKEICGNTIDDNCDGLIDDADTATCAKKPWTFHW